MRNSQRTDRSTMITDGKLEYVLRSYYKKGGKPFTKGKRNASLKSRSNRQKAKAKR